VKRSHERQQVHVFESHFTRQTDAMLHVLDVVVRQRHHEPGHHSVQQTSDIVTFKVVGELLRLSDRAFGGKVCRRIWT